MQNSFTVKVVRDVDARTYVCESDIVGLHIEADTIDAFEEIPYETAIDLIVANHVCATDDLI